jgi:hypothetical protein
MESPETFGSLENTIEDPGIDVGRSRSIDRSIGRSIGRRRVRDSDELTVKISVIRPWH